MNNCLDNIIFKQKVADDIAKKENRIKVLTEALHKLRADSYSVYKMECVHCKEISDFKYITFIQVKYWKEDWWYLKQECKLVCPLCDKENVFINNDWNFFKDKYWAFKKWGYQYGDDIRWQS